MHLQSNKTTCAQRLRISTCHTCTYKFTQHVAALSFRSKVKCAVMRLAVTSAQHSKMGIWGGVERLSYRATPFQHSGRRVSTLTVRHGDAASVAELKGVRMPLIKARGLFFFKGRKSAVVLEGQLLRVEHRAVNSAFRSLFSVRKPILRCNSFPRGRPNHARVYVTRFQEKMDCGLMPDAAYDDAFASWRFIWGCAGG